MLCFFSVEGEIVAVWGINGTLVSELTLNKVQPGTCAAASGTDGNEGGPFPRPSCPADAAICLPLQPPFARRSSIKYSYAIAYPRQNAG